MTVLRAARQPTSLKVRLREISEFVAAISVVRTDDPTISLNPPAAGRNSRREGGEELGGARGDIAFPVLAGEPRRPELVRPR